MKVILTTGKGGVGKTSVAAATAVRCAELGHRTIVASADPAHSLGDAFGAGIGTEPVELGPDLWGQQIDATERLQSSWSEIRDWLLEVVEWGGADRITAEEFLLLPGMEEVVSLIELLSFERSGRWDVVVVDCGPTAETVRLLSLPEVLSWYVDRMFPATRRLNRALAPLVGRLTNLPVARDEVWAATERFLSDLDRVRSLLTGPDTLVRLVVNPQKVVVAESRRTHAYLSLFGYRVDGVVVNRIVPEAAGHPWVERLVEEQSAQVDALGEHFAGLGRLSAHWRAEEPVGVDALSELAADLYGTADPAEPLAVVAPMRLDLDDGGATLELVLGPVERSDVDLARRDGELLVSVGPYRRSLLLPDALIGRPITEARIDSDRVTIRFGNSIEGSPDERESDMTPGAAADGREPSGVNA